VPPDGALPDLTGLGDRLVVKLADVPHRPELGAVDLNVAPAAAADHVARLRSLAKAEGVPQTVAIQQQVESIGEAFIGLQLGTDLGSIVLLGRGGVLVETTGDVFGRLLPLDRSAAEALVDEVAGTVAMSRFRGHAPWPIQPLVDAVLAVDRLWRSLGGAASSVDINPLVVTTDGVLAVDALILAT
jgi:acetate---CoA ligase (ADP-forming)